MPFTSDTFQVYQTEYYTAYTEVLEQQALDMANTRGAIRMEARNLQGDLEKAAFYESIGTGIIQDRDPTDMTAAVWNDLTQGETIGIRVYRSLKEKKAVAAFRQIAQDPRVMSFVVGQQHAKAIALDYLNTGISALVGALNAIPDVQYDATTISGSETITPENLVYMLDKLGDASGRVVAFVMHSKMAHDLLADQVTSSVSTIAGPSIYQGTFGSLSIPVLVTDSPALVDLDPTGDGLTPAQYKVLGLTEGALVLTEAQERDLLTRQDDSAKNLAIQMTTEYSFSTAVKGMAWDGGNYPTSADLATDTNWTFSFSDKRSGPGVIGVFNSRADV